MRFVHLHRHDGAAVPGRVQHERHERLLLCFFLVHRRDADQRRRDAREDERLGALQRRENDRRVGAERSGGRGLCHQRRIFLVLSAPEVRFLGARIGARIGVGIGTGIGIAGAASRIGTRIGIGIGTGIGIGIATGIGRARDLGLVASGIGGSAGNSVRVGIVVVEVSWDAGRPRKLRYILHRFTKSMLITVHVPCTF